LFEGKMGVPQKKDEKFYLKVDFLEDDLDLDLHATQEQIAIGIFGLATNLSPDIIQGVIEGLAEMKQDKLNQIKMGAPN
jgi:hypothetical protein